MKRIQELTIIVEDFIKKQGEKVGVERYKIPKNIFLETLVDTTYSRNRQNEIEFKYNFLNARINKKYYFLHREVKDLISLEDLYSEVIYLIVEELKDKDYVEIDFINYTKQPDDISKLVFRIDKRIKSKVLEYNGMAYNRKKEDEESKKYFSRFGNLLYLDEETEEGIVGETVSEEEAVTTSKSTVQYEEFIDLLNRLNLTQRQREVLIVLERNNFIQAEAVKELDMNYKNLNRMVGRIRKRIKDHYPKVKEEENLQYKIERALSKPVINTKEILDLISKSADDRDLHIIVYSMETRIRKLLFRYMGGEALNEPTKDLIIKEYLKHYYQRKTSK